MDTTQLVALVSTLLVAVGGPLALAVKTSLDRFDAGVAKLLAAHDQLRASVDANTLATAAISTKLNDRDQLRAFLTPAGGVPAGANGPK